MKNFRKYCDRIRILYHTIKGGGDGDEWFFVGDGGGDGGDNVDRIGQQNVNKKP